MLGERSEIDHPVGGGGDGDGPPSDGELDDRGRQLDRDGDGAPPSCCGGDAGPVAAAVTAPVAAAAA